MVDAVIFDMDGLMFDTESVWCTLWKPTLAVFGMEEPEGLADAARGTAGAQLKNTIAQYCGPDCDSDAILTELWHQADLAFARHVEKKPGLDALLAWLAEKQIPMAVASSSMQHYIRNNLELGQIGKYFSVIVSGDRIEHSKPAPDIFLKAAEELGVQPSRTLVLEDSYNGVRAGYAGGFLTVMVPDILPANEEMAQKYTACCKDLFEVKDLLAQGKLG